MVKLSCQEVNVADACFTSNMSVTLGFNERLRAARKRHEGMFDVDLGQEEIAAFVSERVKRDKPYSAQSAGGWLRKAWPPPDVIVALAELFDVDPGWLAFGPASEAPAPQGWPATGPGSGGVSPDVDARVRIVDQDSLGDQGESGGSQGRG